MTLRRSVGARPRARRDRLAPEGRFGGPVRAPPAVAAAASAHKHAPPARAAGPESTPDKEMPAWPAVRKM